MATANSEVKTQRRGRRRKSDDEDENTVDLQPEAMIETLEPAEDDVPKPQWVSEEDVPDTHFPNKKYGAKRRRAADVTAMLEQHMGRWLKIHCDYTTPSELYLYNKGKGQTDAKVTVRGWSAVQDDRADYYFATIISGGLQGRVD